MTADDTVTVGLPTMSARAVIGCTLLGLGGFALAQPTSVAGAVAGLFLGVGITWFSGSLWRRTFAGAVLPLGVIGTVAVLLFAISERADVSSLATGIVSLLSVLLGIAIVALSTDSLSMRSLDLAAKSAFVSALVGSLLALVALRIVSLGGLGDLLALALGWTGPGPIGVTVWLVATTIVAIVAVLSIPVPPVDSMEAAGSSFQQRKRLVATITIVGLVGIVSTVVLATAVATSVLPPLGNLTVVQAPLVVLFALCLVLAAFGIVVRIAWLNASGTKTDIVVLLVGSSFGVVVTLGALGLVTTDVGAFLGVPAALGVAGVVLFILPNLLAQFDARTGFVPVSSGVAVSLVAGAVVLGAVTRQTTGVGQTELGVLIAVGAGLVAFELGSYGRTMTVEVGPSGASRLPQVARIGWAGGLVFVGIGVAAVGLEATTLFAPTLVVPAAVGVGGALLGVLSIAWLFFKSSTSA